MNDVANDIVRITLGFVLDVGTNQRWIQDVVTLLLVLAVCFHVDLEFVPAGDLILGGEQIDAGLIKLWEKAGPGSPPSNQMWGSLAIKRSLSCSLRGLTLEITLGAGYHGYMKQHSD